MNRLDGGLADCHSEEAEDNEVVLGRKIPNGHCSTLASTSATFLAVS